MSINTSASRLKGSNLWIQSSFGDDVTCLGSSCSSSQTYRKRMRNYLKNDGNVEKLCDVTEMWSCKFQPQSKDELAIHKKKISEVDDWLIRSTKSSKSDNSRLLLLTGPAGCGKTMTLKVLCQHHGIQIHEWINPSSINSSSFTSSKDYGGQKSESQMTIFKDFLLRANKYPSLNNLSKSSGGRLVLVEEYPNVLFQDQTEFHNILSRYNRISRCPIVFIVTDAVGHFDNEKVLFPKNIQSEVNIHCISFNPISNTSMTKALNSMMDKAVKMNLCSNKLPKDVISKLCESSSGDIRSASNSLQFFCTERKRKTNYSNKVAAKKKNKKKTTTVHDDENDFGFFFGRDASLSLFRTIGKILYCKRLKDVESISEKLPTHLDHHVRHPLSFCPEDIIERSLVSPESLNLFLHQNYLQFVGHIDDLVRISDYFSAADFLISEWTDQNVMEYYGSAVAARGIMHSNTRIVSSGWQPLHKPEWYAANKTKRQRKMEAKNEISDIIRQCANLFTDYIPFMKYLKYPLTYCKRGKSDVLQKLCTFSSQNDSRRLNPKRQILDDDVSAFEESLNECVDVGRRPQEVDYSAAPLDVDDPLDFHIEEYDD